MKNDVLESKSTWFYPFENGLSSVVESWIRRRPVYRVILFGGPATVHELSQATHRSKKSGSLSALLILPSFPSRLFFSFVLALTSSEHHRPRRTVFILDPRAPFAVFSFLLLLLLLLMLLLRLLLRLLLLLHPLLLSRLEISYAKAHHRVFYTVKICAHVRRENAKNFIADNMLTFFFRFFFLLFFM